MISETHISFGKTPQQVLVTGATGFIGKLLVKALIADGHSVIVLSRHPARAEQLFDAQVKAIASMQELPASYAIDTIINLAGARILGWRWTQARKEYLRKSRIQLTQMLIDWIAAAERKPKLLLSASAIGYYGIQKIGDDTELDEDSHTQSIFMASLCHDWEQVAQAASRYGVQVGVMRFGLVLGQGGALPMMLLPIKLGMGGALGSGRQWQSWIHVEDLLRAMAHLWRQHEQWPTAEPVQRFNFTAPETVTQLDFSKTAARILHRPCVLPTPAWPMRILLGEQADLLLEGQRVIPKALLGSGFQFRYPTLDSALRDLCQ